MNKKLGIWLVLGLFLSGCASEQPTMKAQESVIKLEKPKQEIGTVDGALIAHDLSSTHKSMGMTVSSDQPVIVECPSCNQRVDVTGLPRERILCPNCNSLFKY